MPSTFTVDLDGAVAANDLPADFDDPLISGANGGNLLDIDLTAGGWSYPSANNPANGDAVLDYSGQSALNSVVTLGGTGAIVRAGNGLDFGQVINPGQRIEGPASVSTTIWGGGTVDQYYLCLLYVRLPPKANWPTSANYSRPVPLLTFATNSLGFSGEPDLFSINLLNSNARLRAVRPTDGTTSFETFDITPADGDYGQVVQFALWRDPDGQTFRLRSPRGQASFTRPSGANNPTDFSGRRPQIGVGTAIWNNGSAAGKSFRFYRAYIEALAISRRSPLAVADDDYTAVFRYRGLPFS